MHRLLTAIAAAGLMAGPAMASDQTDVMSIVHQWIDALDKGDMKTFVGLCADAGSILDDFPPYQWQGPDACSRWWNDYDALAKANEITDGFVALGKPLQVSVIGKHAYVVTRDNFTYKMKGKPMKQVGSIHTLVLEKGGAGWRITGEAWAATAQAAPVKAGS